MKRVCIFNPLHVLTNMISLSDIEGFKIFKLSQHPQIMVQIEVMKIEVITYKTPADSINPLVERHHGRKKHVIHQMFYLTDLLTLVARCFTFARCFNFRYQIFYFFNHLPDDLRNITSAR